MDLVLSNDETRGPEDFTLTSSIGLPGRPSRKGWIWRATIRPMKREIVEFGEEKSLGRWTEGRELQILTQTSEIQRPLDSWIIILDPRGILLFIVGPTAVDELVLEVVECCIMSIETVLSDL